MGTQGEPDGVHGTVGRQGAGHVLLQGRVGGGVVRLVGSPVSQEIDADDLPTLVLQQVHPARLAPVAFERRGKPVHQ